MQRAEEMGTDRDRRREWMRNQGPPRSLSFTSIILLLSGSLTFRLILKVLIREANESVSVWFTHSVMLTLASVILVDLDTNITVRISITCCL